MREAECSLEFHDGTEPVDGEGEEHSVDLRSIHGDIGVAELAVGRSRKAAKTKAKKMLEGLLLQLEQLDAEEDHSTNP